MTKDGIICDNEGCENIFVKMTHNQKYCSDECCRQATNAKIKQRNLDKKDRMNGKKRICKTRGCDTVLSRYSEQDVCMKCNAAKAQKELSHLLEMINNVTS